MLSFYQIFKRLVDLYSDLNLYLLYNLKRRQENFANNDCHQYFYIRVHYGLNFDDIDKKFDRMYKTHSIFYLRNSEKKLIIGFLDELCRNSAR